MPIDYESRIARLSVNEAESPLVDSEFEEITAGEVEGASRNSRPGRRRRMMSGSYIERRKAEANQNAEAGSSGSYLPKFLYKE